MAGTAAASADPRLGADPDEPPGAPALYRAAADALHKEAARVKKKQKLFHEACAGGRGSQDVQLAFRELSACVGKLGKAIDRETQRLDLAKAQASKPLPTQAMDALIADHLARDGRVEALEAHLSSAGVGAPPAADRSVQAALAVAHALRCRDLAPALQWLDTNETALAALPDPSTSARVAAAANTTDAPASMPPPPSLVRPGDQPPRPAALLVHSLRFLELARTAGVAPALAYARKNLAPFAAHHARDVQRLMGSLLIPPHASPDGPYASLAGDALWNAAADAVQADALRLVGLPAREPLGEVYNVGMEVLPTLHKLTTVLSRSGGGDWASRATLPVALELSPAHTYASTFVCPVSRERASMHIEGDNPPVLLPCGHALSHVSVRQLAKPPHGRVKCPYCSSAESSLGDTLRLSF